MNFLQHRKEKQALNTFCEMVNLSKKDLYLLKDHDLNMIDSSFHKMETKRLKLEKINVYSLRIVYPVYDDSKPSIRIYFSGNLDILGIVKFSDNKQQQVVSNYTSLCYLLSNMRVHMDQDSNRNATFYLVSA